MDDEGGKTEREERDPFGKRYITGLVSERKYFVVGHGETGTNMDSRWLSPASRWKTTAGGGSRKTQGTGARGNMTARQWSWYRAVAMRQCSEKRPKGEVPFACFNHSLTRSPPTDPNIVPGLRLAVPASQ